MMAQVLPLATLVTALGCGLMSGAFFAFSAFVMKALATLPPAQGIRAMQAINAAAPTGWFLAALLGSAAACALLAVCSPLAWSQPGARLRLAGCLLYVVGTFLVTVAFNVPRNDALAAVQPDAVGAAAVWARYLSSWTAWNHVRTLAGLAATGLLTVALWLDARA